jgi:hypothetical protein
MVGREKRNENERKKSTTQRLAENGIRETEPMYTFLNTFPIHYYNFFRCRFAFEKENFNIFCETTKKRHISRMRERKIEGERERKSEEEKKILRIF